MVLVQAVIGWEWPAPEAETCGAQATDRATGKHVYCCLRRGHSCQEHHWEEIRGDELLSATWISTGLVTFIGTPSD